MTIAVNLSCVTGKLTPGMSKSSIKKLKIKLSFDVVIIIIYFAAKSPP